MIDSGNVVSEKSTLVLRITFLDEDDQLVVPTAASWTLTDKDGLVINERRDVPISPLAAIVNLVLYGDDLALAGAAASKYKRIVTIQATYDSSIGTNLPLTEEVMFQVQSSRLIA